MPYNNIINRLGIVKFQPIPDHFQVILNPSVMHNFSVYRVPPRKLSETPWYKE